MRRLKPWACLDNRSGVLCAWGWPRVPAMQTAGGGLVSVNVSLCSCGILVPGKHALVLQANEGNQQASRGVSSQSLMSYQAHGTRDQASLTCFARKPINVISLVRVPFRDESECQHRR